MLLYLLAARPYAEWQLQGVEVLCHAAELGLFVAALAVARQLQAQAATYAMIGTCVRAGVRTGSSTAGQVQVRRGTLVSWCTALCAVRRRPAGAWACYILAAWGSVLSIVSKGRLTPASGI